MRQRGFTFPGTFTNLAGTYSALGQFQKGQQVLQEYLQRNAHSAAATFGLGQVLAVAGKADEALAAYAKGEALDPGNLRFEMGRRDLRVLAEQWAEVDAADRRLRQSADSFFKFTGDMNLAADALYRGRVSDALKFCESAASGAGAWCASGRAGQAVRAPAAGDARAAAT